MTGFWAVLCTSGFWNCVWDEGSNSRKPSSGIRLVVACLGLRWYECSMAGIPVDDRQLISPALSRRYPLSYRDIEFTYNTLVWELLMVLLFNKALLIPILVEGFGGEIVH